MPLNEEALFSRSAEPCADLAHMPRKVVVLQHRLLHYRVPLFQRVRATCAANRIEFCIVNGQPTASEMKKRDAGFLDWADIVTNRYVRLGGRDILWQPFPKRHRDAALVIMMQENRLVSNYPWLFWRNRTKAKIAYWGHGRNFQTDTPGGLREKWKKHLIRHVDWWFAYTQMTRDILLGDRYPDERITVLDNAIDNEAFLANMESITVAELDALREALGTDETAPIGLFCGSLYPDKRIAFMIEAADRIRAEIPEFVLVVIGDGPSADEVKSARVSRPWLHWVGAKQGRDKAAYFKLARVVFNPGAVGLHVLDSFCAAVPMATTSGAKHGPEIAYLENGVNALIVPGGVTEYSSEVVELIKDRTKYEAMRANALASASRYTLDNMVGQFCNGVEQCLAMPKER